MIVVNRYLTVCANDGSDEFNYIVCNGSTLHKKHPYLNRSNVKLLDSCFQEVFDTCNGHAEPNQNSYHYHKLPICICDTNNRETEQFMGVALDGFPIYSSWQVRTPLKCIFQPANEVWGTVMFSHVPVCPRGVW